MFTNCFTDCCYLPPVAFRHWNCLWIIGRKGMSRTCSYVLSSPQKQIMVIIIVDRLRLEVQQAVSRFSQVPD